MKKIIITGGPTNEYIDEVMKITNMSTGTMSVALGDLFLSSGYSVCMILNNSVKMQQVSDALKIIRVETTEEMLQALEAESKLEKYDAIIHASAVGDYKAEFSFLLEDLADEIFAGKDKIKSPKDILKIMENPKCKIDDDTKIDSYQKNLTVKLGLTPKIIEKLRGWYPDTFIVGFKLLDHVSKDELFRVAQELCIKNDVDFVIANDLEDLGKGKTERYLVNKKGYTGKVLEYFNDIFGFIDENLKR